MAALRNCSRKPRLLKGGQLNFYYDQDIKLTGLVSFDMLFHEVSFPETRKVVSVCQVLCS